MTGEGKANRWTKARDLHSALEREKAAIGAFLRLEKHAKPMLREATEAGLHRSSPLTRLSMENSPRPDSPDARFKKAPRSRAAPAKTSPCPRPLTTDH